VRRELTEDIRALLAASRELSESDEVDLERLQAWGAEHRLIFGGLKEKVSALAGSDPSIMASLLRELIDLDAKICARIVENQTRLGAQIAAARKIRQALCLGAGPTCQSLQRLV
jgi:hypothetical protein